MENTASFRNPAIERAQALLGMGKPDAAKKMLQEALAQEPDDDGIEALLGYTLSQLEEYKPAEFHVRNSLSRDPGNPLYHYFYAEILKETGRDQESEREILEAIHIFPLDADFHTFYAWLLYKDGQVDKAESIARNALKLEPENEAALSLLGAKNIDDFDMDTARETFQRSLSHNPESPHAHAGMSQTYLMDNKPEAALQEAREAIRLNPNDPFFQEMYLTTVKAKHPLYALFWRWSLFCVRLGRTASLVMIFGLWFAYSSILRFARHNSEWLAQHPTISYILYGFIIAYILFCIYTWVANPIFSFLAKRGYLK